jgi:DNA modification methylase
MKLTSREINIELSNNGNGGGYWSLYCGDNSKNILPTEEHWNKLCEILNIDINYSDINTQFRPYNGQNLWDDVYYEDDKMLSGVNRPVLFYERLIEMNRKDPNELLIWDPFCGYGNSTKACKKLGASFYASEFDPKIYYKALINIGNITNSVRPNNESS